MDLHGSVEVPRAALYGFRDFVNRFRTATVESKEVQEKLRWIDSLLESQPMVSQWTQEMSEAAYRSRVRSK